ncbi:MAG: hypothetical protein ACI89X_003691 [Planctomycetota bacterium]|jgi:uncharacterized protein (DUF924 family)
MHTRAEAIIEFWFGGRDDLAGLRDADNKLALWWKKNSVVDTEIRNAFEADHHAAARGEFADWEADPIAVTGLIVLLDQVSRNIYRGTPHSWATDGLARGVCHRAIASGVLGAIPLSLRVFAAMPLMHSEDLADHEVGGRVFAALHAEATEKLGELGGKFAGNVDFMAKHTVIIERFGRYPHRNAVLGRTSTEQEAIFLSQPGSSF